MIRSDTIKLRGGAPWTRRRRIGHYGGAPDKQTTAVEETPHAWAWLQQLRAYRGSAYTKATGTLVHAEHLAMARFFAGLTRAAERFQANSNPLTADERLGYWVRFLGVPVSTDDTRQEIRLRCVAKYQAANAIDASAVDASIAQLLGDNYVRSWRTVGSSIATPPVVTYWPVINPGPAADSLGGGTWYSDRARLTVEVQQTIGQTDADFARAMNVDLPALLEPLLPAHSVWQWSAELSEGGFTLDDSDLDYAGLAEGNVYASWEAATPAADGTLDLPSWLTYTCATSGTTAQTSASTLRTGFAVNAARGFSRDGSTWGLLVEPGAVNRVPSQDVSGWSTVGTPSAIVSATGPDGAVSAYTGEDADAGAFEYYRDVNAVAGLSGAHVLSCWLADMDTDSEVRCFELAGIGAMAKISAPAAVGWGFYSDNYDSTAPTTDVELDFLPATVSSTRTGSASIAYIQVEDGRLYPTSFIDGTRDDGSLLADQATAAPHGYFDVEVSIIALGASIDFADGFDVVREDADTRCHFDPSDDTFKFQVDGGSTISVGPVAWDQYDTITVRVRHSPLGRFLSVSGGMSGNGNAEGAPADYLVTGDLYIFTKGASGATEGGAITAVIAHEV